MASNQRIRPYHFNIEYFRNFKEVSFELGKKITVISGQNGVGKSNLLSLIASGSGVNKKSVLGSNFQPEFYDFFNVDKDEDFENYKLYLTYAEDDGRTALTKRLSFKDDTKTGRGIRIIPRTTNVNIEDCTLKQAEEKAKMEYNVGGAARVRIPTIYLSLSRLYPLGERKDTVKITEIRKTNPFYQKKADEKYKYWYNTVIPNSIKNEAVLSKVEKNTCSRASLHMDINNTPTLSQSIGQDNLGNIISALVDIYMLSLDEDYKGALLCIDEIDVSLHPDTQIRLLDLFNQLSEELSIQFVVSTHSLTILKEVLKKEKRNSTDFKVVYLKTPSAPYVTDRKSYELLKADMFGSLSFQRPKVKVYFEDEIGKAVFGMLMDAFRNIYHAVESNIETPVLRNSSDVRDYAKINDSIHSLGGLLQFTDNTKYISTVLGCEELFKVNDADEYFKRVEAIEFAVKYDDGRDPRGILYSDLVLIGISRTSKTPLSQYLALKRLKVANVPIVPEIEPPEELFQVPKEKCVGLKINPKRLIHIRKERLKTLGLSDEASYANLKRIQEELVYFEQLIEKIGCPVVDVTNKAVEETANLVLGALNTEREG